MSKDRLSVVFAALADPHRRAILARLLEGGATVGELAAPLPMTLPAVSKHLTVLERAGLISRTRTAQWRTSHLQTEPLVEAMAWIEPYRQIWDERLDRLDHHLRDRTPPGTPDPGPHRADRPLPTPRKKATHG